ncbi:type II toxin-antitoxin system RelE/ParE family toxin [Chryseobacterium sp. 3008163]|uniref:type II toxin-antitoxin system RelE/ParE family toxin n=1 Tax=Chryseobacterium sp. 3008163 TaxID=2478663 RepID=UPI000F0C60D5|nr:type II toxin-antitoxin system RelE/ParE family toxin [Chryseobacterium sp. 3008163]AYN01576.1 type II toxin-antitoxin system RelE/ParE family toxin [Chryseobacterium sp. 3008163]
MLKVKWTSEAQEQYFKTLEFWIDHNQSTSYSEKIIEEIINTESLLIINPFIGLIVENTNDKVRRVLILHNFSLYYRITYDTLEIISFWGNKMNPDDLKL